MRDAYKPSKIFRTGKRHPLYCFGPGYPRCGNLLGAEQSGFYCELGYEAYQKILAEAIEELRDKFSDLYEKQQRKKHVEEIL